MNTKAENTLAGEALAEILQWEDMRRSPQLADFLRYVVTAKISGNETAIKAYSIAVDVFGRPESFDPQTDPIVRVQGGRLRRLLQKYYETQRPRTPLKIIIPKGRYVPEFTHPGRQGGSTSTRTAVGKPTTKPVDEPLGKGAKASSRPIAIVWQWATVLSIMVFSGLAGVLISSRPQQNMPHVPLSPAVTVGTITNLTNMPGLNAFAEGLSTQLAADLARFDSVIILPGNVGMGAVQDNLLAGHRIYALDGVMRSGSYGLEYNLILSDRKTHEVVWSNTFTQPSTSASQTAETARVSMQAVANIGNVRGPLHVDGRNWASGLDTTSYAPNAYVCSILLNLARDRHTMAAIEKGQDCYERLLADVPAMPVAIAGRAGLAAQAVFLQRLERSEAQTQLDAAAQEVRTARNIAPFSTFVRAQAARVLAISGYWSEAREEYLAALQRNPADVDVRAEFALALGLSGRWDEGERQMETAIAEAPNPPSWYFLLRAINALRESNFELALTTAQTLQGGARSYGMLIALCAAKALGRDDIVMEYKARIIDNPSFSSFGIVPWLSRNMNDDALVAELADDLRAAGIDEALIQGNAAAN